MKYNFNLIDVSNDTNRTVTKCSFDITTGILLWHEIFVEVEQSTHSDTSTTFDTEQVSYDDEECWDRRDKIRFCYLSFNSVISVADCSASISHPITVKAISRSPPSISAISPAIVDFHHMSGGCWITVRTDEEDVLVMFYDFAACTMVSINITQYLTHCSVNAAREEEEASSESKTGSAASFSHIVCPFVSRVGTAPSKSRLQQQQSVPQTIFITNTITGATTAIKRSKHHLVVLSHNPLSETLRRQFNTSIPHNISHNDVIITDVHVAFEDGLCAFLFMLTKEFCYLVKHTHTPLELSCAELFTSSTNGIRSSRAVSARVENLQDDRRFVAMKLPHSNSYYCFALYNSTLSTAAQSAALTAPSAHHLPPISVPFTSNLQSCKDSILGSVCGEGDTQSVFGEERGMGEDFQQSREGEVLLLLRSESSVLQLVVNTESNSGEKVKNGAIDTKTPNSFQAQVNVHFFKQIYCMSHQFNSQFWASLLVSNSTEKTASSSAATHHRSVSRSIAQEEELEKLATSTAYKSATSRQRSGSSNELSIDLENILDMPMDRAFLRGEDSIERDCAVGNMLLNGNKNNKPLKNNHAKNMLKRAFGVDGRASPAAAKPFVIFDKPYPLASTNSSSTSFGRSSMDGVRSTSSSRASSAATTPIAAEGQRFFPAPQHSASTPSVTETEMELHHQSSSTSSYLVDLLRHEEGLSSLNDVDRISLSHGAATCRHSRSRSASNVSGTSGSSWGASESTAYFAPVLNVHNIDDFVNSCMLELSLRTAPPAAVSRPTSLPNSRAPSVSTIPAAVTPVLTRQFEPVFAQDVERDEELQAILQEYLAIEISRINSNNCGVGGVGGVGDKICHTISSSHPISSHVDSDLSALPRHWVDTLDLVTLTPSSGDFGAECDVVSTVYDLIGPFRLLQLVRVLSPEADVVNAASVTATSKSSATFHSMFHSDHHQSTQYTVDRMVSRLLFAQPQSLFDVVLFLLNVETDLKVKHETSLSRSLHLDDALDEQRAQSLFRDEQSPDVVTNDGFSAVYCERDRGDSLDSCSSSDDDDAYTLLFRDVGEDEEDEEQGKFSEGDQRIEKVHRTPSRHHKSPRKGHSRAITPRLVGVADVTNEDDAVDDHSAESVDFDDYSFFRTVHSDDDEEGKEVEGANKECAPESIPLPQSPLSTDIQSTTDNVSVQDDNDEEQDVMDVDLSADYQSDPETDHALFADLEPLSRRVSVSSPHLSRMSPAELYSRHSLGEKRLSGFSSMLQLDQPLATADSEKQSVEATSPPHSPPTDRHVRSLLHESTISCTFHVTLRDQLHLLAVAIVSHNLRRGSGGVDDVEDRLSSDDDEQTECATSHFALLTCSQQECLLQILFLTGAYHLAIEAMFAWERLDLLTLLTLRVTASAHHVSHHLESSAHDEHYRDWFDDDRQRVFDGEYFTSGRGRFLRAHGFESRPPLPEPVVLGASTAPEWTCAVGNNWDLGSLDGVSSDGDRDQTEKRFTELQRGASIAPVTSFAQKRMLEAVSLFTRVLRHCLQNKHQGYANQISKYRPKWVTDQMVTNIYNELGNDRD